MSDWFDRPVYADADEEHRADRDAWLAGTDTLGARCSGDRGITRAEADEDAERPWSRTKWLETGDGYY